MATDPNLWSIIINPTAGNGSAGRCWPEIEQELQRQGFSYTVKWTETRGHAARLADDAILNGHRKILGIGGDGTNHEICNGILAQKWAPTTEVLYGLLPVGTGNDWARQWKISHNFRERLESLKLEHSVFQDAGQVFFQKNGRQESRFFVNVAGLAYDGYIAQRLENQLVASKFRYLLMVGKCLFGYELLPAEIYFDGQVARDHFYTINIGVCRFSGGGMQLVPQAVPDDGLFALTFARKLAKWEVLAQTPRFYNGSILEHPKVEGFSAKNIEVRHPENAAPTLLEADGEFLGETPCTFFILEKALKICL